jgi:hypothetical protein
MTDITNTTPISLHRLSLLRLELPKLGVGFAVSVMSESVMRAFELAYVAPFSAMQRKLAIVFDEDLEGRDPNW